MAKNVFIDWFKFTFLPFDSVDETMKIILGILKSSSSLGFVAKEADKGMHGYKNSFDIFCYLNGEVVKVATFAYGGEAVNGTNLLDLTGMCCSLIKDWTYFHDFISQVKAKITRIDLAIDFVNGEVTIDDVKHLYLIGEFNSGGRVPSYKEFSGGSLDAIDFNGRTFQIGKRKNGKVLRAYEKGRQLGDVFSVWVRLEVEFGSRDRVIPYDALLNCPVYFVGAHKALEKFVNFSSVRIKTHIEQSKISLDRSEHWIKTSAGKHIDQLLKHKFNNDLAEFVSSVRVNGTPKRLINTALAKHLIDEQEPSSI